MAPVQSQKLIARNVAAVRRFADASSLVRTMAGNPVSTRLEFGFGNCFPGWNATCAISSGASSPSSKWISAISQIALVGVDFDGVARATAAGGLSQADAANYSILANELATGRAVFVSRLSGSFGVLGRLDLTLDSPSTQADFPRSSTGPNRRPPDAWTAVRPVDGGDRCHARIRQ